MLMAKEVFMLESNYSDQHYWEPFLNLESAGPTPIAIRSMGLYCYRGTYLVRSESTDGTVGIATANRRCSVLYPMFKELIIPAFVGRDARDLEEIVKDVYTFRNNYKYQGTAFWNCVAYAEASAFDLLGQATGKSVGQLLGGAWIGKRLAETSAQAVKMKIGGRKSPSTWTPMVPITTAGLSKSVG